MSFLIKKKAQNVDLSSFVPESYLTLTIELLYYDLYENHSAHLLASYNCRHTVSTSRLKYYNKVL